MYIMIMELRLNIKKNIDHNLKSTVKNHLIYV